MLIQEQVYQINKLKGESDKEKIIDSLNKASNFIELTLAKRIDIRKMPQISFHYDTSFEYGNNIDRIIDEIHKED